MENVTECIERLVIYTFFTPNASIVKDLNIIGFWKFEVLNIKKLGIGVDL